MRRSNSLSQIPVRTWGSSIASTSSKKEKIRSGSVGRPSKDTTYLLKPKRTVSPEHQGSTKRTPLTRQRSLMRNTPATASSSHSRVSPSVGFIERKTIQKLSMNKIWVAKEYEKVQKFILNSNLFDPQVVTTKNIKPPSIKAFVYMVTILLNECFATVKITMENYKEEIPRLLNTMDYPGNLTKSTLKTVNTMHSWPQVIGLLGWLIDKVTLVERAKIDFNDLSKEAQCDQIRTEYILKRYENFCNRNEDIDELNKNFFTDLAVTLGVDTDTYHKLKNECDELKAVKNKLQKENEELEQTQKDLQMKYKKINDELIELQEADAEKEAAVESELNYYNALLRELVEKENELKANVLKMEASIKEQPCTLQEKRNIMSKIQNMNSEAKILKENMEYLQRVKQDIENSTLEKMENLRSLVAAWNRSLTLICIKKPYFKQLLLKEKGFHRAEFLQEIHHVVEQKRKIETKVESKVKELETALKPLKIALVGIENELKETQSDIESVMAKSKQFSDKTIDVNNEKLEKMKTWELKKEQLLSSIKEVEDDKQLESLQEELAQLEQRREKDKKELEDLKISGMKFFVELGKIIRENTLALMKVVEDVRKKTERMVEMNLEERERFNTFLENILKENNS